jgi:hypothetical protein
MSEADSHVSEIAGWSIPATIKLNATAARIGNVGRLEAISLESSPTLDLIIRSQNETRAFGHIVNDLLPI